MNRDQGRPAAAAGGGPGPGRSSRFADPADSSPPAPARNTLTRDYLRQPGAADVGARLRAALAARPDLVASYGHRFLSRPLFLDAAETRALESDLRGLVYLLTTLPARLTSGDLGEFARRLGHPPRFAEAMDRLGGTPSRSAPAAARADLYHDGTGFKVLEVNLSAALGGVDNATIAEVSLGVPEIARFAADRGLSHPRTIERFADALRRRAGRARPVVALVDWPTSYPGLAERLHHLAGYLSDRGIWAIPGSAAELRVRAGRLTLDGVPVDVVWRMFTLTEMLADPDGAELGERMLRVEQEGLARSLTPFTDELYEAKSGLALLFEPGVRATLSAAERALVDRSVAPSWRVRAAAETPDEPARRWRSERTRLILKPVAGKAGSGVVAGWSVSDREWSDLLAAATGEGGHVLQRRVVPRPEAFADPAAGGRLRPWLLKWGVFLMAGRYAGAAVHGVRDLDARIVNLSTAEGFGACLNAAPPRSDARAQQQAG